MCSHLIPLTILLHTFSSLAHSNDFTFYDHVLDMSVLLGNIPAKYANAAKEHQLSTLDVMFAMGRGRQRDGVDVEACESALDLPASVFVLLANNLFCVRHQ